MPNTPVPASAPGLPASCNLLAALTAVSAALPVAVLPTDLPHPAQATLAAMLAAAGSLPLVLPRSGLRLVASRAGSLTFKGGRARG